MRLTASTHLRHTGTSSSLARRGRSIWTATRSGASPAATAAAVEAVAREWGRDLISGWDRWIDLPGAVGDRIGQLIGAAPGQVVVSDSTTVNLYKLAVAAMDANAERTVIVGDKHDFPTVRYVLQGVAARVGGHVRFIETDPVNGLSPADVVAAIDASAIDASATGAAATIDAATGASATGAAAAIDAAATAAAAAGPLPPGPLAPPAPQR